MQKIYCGPNLLKYNLMRFQVFIGDDYPYNVKEAINAIPAVNFLFCEIGELENMRARIADTGSAESVYYAKVENFVKEMKRRDNKTKQAANV